MGEDVKGNDYGLSDSSLPKTCVEVLRKATEATIFSLSRDSSESGTSRMQTRSLNWDGLFGHIHRKRDVVLVIFPLGIPADFL